MSLSTELNKGFKPPRKSRKTRLFPRAAARLRTHPCVWFVDGRDQGFEDWFVTLHTGWHWDGYPAEHAHGFTTLREALAAVEKVQPCDCEQCREESARQGS
jgi:hypothetical protein